MTVILPERAGANPPVLYLLHGRSDDDTSWTRWTSIERYVAPLRLAVVMPQVHRSYYTDEWRGNRYWTFLSAELPELVSNLFRVSTRREDTYVAGLSMGGYGAFKWALRQPARFAAAASFSGALDVAGRVRANPAGFAHIFGADPTGTSDDLHWLLDQADPAKLPRFYASCGSSDFLYPDNLAFAEACQRKGIPLTVEFGPGDHDWGYWDRQIQNLLGWLDLDDTGG